MKKTIKCSVITLALLGMSGTLLAILHASAATTPQTFFPAASAPVATVPLTAPTPQPAAVLTANNPAMLDAHRRYALGMIETGNDDLEIGGAGEVSRYQIMPSVWKQYSQSRSYHDPETSLEVAQQHWFALYTRFQQQAHRQPTDFDMYVLWNTRYGYYAKKGFDPDRLNAVIRDRAQRFVNLVECGAT
jgi:hypothetical protein